MNLYGNRALFWSRSPLGTTTPPIQYFDALRYAFRACLLHVGMSMLVNDVDAAAAAAGQLICRGTGV